MTYFRRVLQYVFPQYKAPIASILCAFIVAVLFSLSIAAMLPLMKVMIGEEGLHGWINRAIIKHRSGISFEAGTPEESLTAMEDSKTSSQPLRVISIRGKSRAYGSGLLKNDIIIALSREAQINDTFTRDELLERLAWAESDKPIELLVEHPENREKEKIRVNMDQPPSYAPAAKRLLQLVPRQRGIDFKRNCIILIIVVILVATILRCLLRFAQEYLIRRISFSSIMSLRRDAYGKAVRLPLSYFSREGISDTMSRFVQDSNRIHLGITTLLGKAVREPFKIIALGIVAFKINADMSLIVIMGTPIAVVVIGKLGRKMKRATKRTLESWSRMLGHLQGTLLGIRIVKGYHQEKYEENRFRLINVKLLQQQFRMAKIDAASGPILEALGVTAACIGMICAAYWLFDANGSEMSTSDFFTLVMVLGTMAESGRKLGNVYPRIQTANASAERVYRLVDVPVEVDPPQAKHLSPLSRSLEIRNVSFRYPGSPTATLQDINLTVRVGETIAVVGPNGAGKTTLLSLIPRFFIPENGAIYIDGTDITQVSLSSLRRQIGIVTQQTVVFNDTIAVNIAYGDPQAGEEKIVSAAQRAYAHEFIEQTANGYQTIVGEQGVTLSGGQLQRLAIARAILLDPAILIFDEAMSQIDSDSEAKIQKALEQFKQDRTSFIIAHRLSTVVNADQIIVLDQGKLIGQGKHQELVENCELYRQLYEMQFGTS